GQRSLVLGGKEDVDLSRAGLEQPDRDALVGAVDPALLVGRTLRPHGGVAEGVDHLALDADFLALLRRRQGCRHAERQRHRESGHRKLSHSVPPSEPPRNVCGLVPCVGRNDVHGNPPPVRQRRGSSSHRRSQASASSPSALPTPCPLSCVRTKRKRSGTPARAYARSRTWAVDSAHEIVTSGSSTRFTTRSAAWTRRSEWRMGSCPCSQRSYSGSSWRGCPAMPMLEKRRKRRWSPHAATATAADRRPSAATAWSVMKPLVDDPVMPMRPGSISGSVTR